MIKKLLLSLFISVLALNGAALAGELKISPEKVTENATLSFAYKSVNQFKEGSGLYLFLYAYNNKGNMPTAKEYPLSYDPESKKYSVSLSVPPNTVFALIKVGNGKDFDNNRGRFWDLLVFDKQNKVLPGAQLKAGLSNMGNMPDNIQRTPNLIKALDYLKKEAELDPSNIQAAIGLASLKFDMKKISKDEFNEAIKKALDLKFDTNKESDVRAVSRALKTINRNEDAETLEKGFAVKNSNSELAEEISIANLAKASSRDEFTDGVTEFLKKYPKSSSRERIFSALVSGYLQGYQYDKLKVLLNSYEDVPSSALTQLAFEVSENKKIMPDATAIEKNAEALKIMQNAYLEASKSKIEDKPSHISPMEWELQREMNKAVVNESYAKIYLNNKNYEKAAEKYLLAKNILGNSASAILYESLMEAYYFMQNYGKAFDVAEEAILNTKSTTEINKIFFDLYKKNAKDTTKFDKYMESLLLKAKTRRIDDLKSSMLNLSANMSEIETPTGIKIDLNMMKGKVIVIDFWASWCAPCADALTSMQNLYNLYDANDKIIFAAINVWEKSDDRLQTVKDYIEKGEYEMPFYIDQNDALPNKIGVMGLPTTVFIDKEGKVQFIETGFTNDEEFIRTASDKLEILLGK